MKKRAHFETMKAEQLEIELRQLDAIQGRLHREQKTYKQWISEILQAKRADETIDKEQERAFTKRPLFIEDYAWSGQWLETTHVRQQCMAGLTDLLNGVRTGVTTERSDGWHEATQDLAMIEEAVPHVAWAEALGPTDVRAMENIHNPKTIFCAIAPTHPEASSMQNAFHAVEDNSFFIVKIKPVQMKPLWAGLAAAHELKHIKRMQDRELRIDTPDLYAEEERLALRLEANLLDAYTGGAFRNHLDRAIKEYDMHDCMDMFDFARIPPHRFSKELDMLLGHSKPRSYEEGGVRTGIYMPAMAFRFNERETDPETRRSMDRAFAKRLYKRLIDNHPF